MRVLAGVTATLAIARPIQALLFGVEATDPRVLVTVAISLAIVAGIAQRVLSNIDLLRKGGIEGAIDALKGLIR